MADTHFIGNENSLPDGLLRPCCKR